jgi:2-C-methyl-D-erythritol 2,4-cyclodiphosphate synthase
MSMSVFCLLFLALMGETWGFSRGVSSLFRRPVVPLRSSSISDDEPLLRIGHGFDIHRLIEGTKLVIGGEEIPFKLGADAHSDGDAMYHSIVDAILGALTLPDIGQLFPDNDPNWKGADSSIFMEEAYRRMTDRGYRIGNVDVTLILQTPKVKDIKPAMKENIVRLLRTNDGRVNIKARTHEKVDSIGESRSYACHVVVLLEKIPK